LDGWLSLNGIENSALIICYYLKKLGCDMKNVIVIVILTSLIGCTFTLTPAGERVRVTSNPDAVKGCMPAGMVEGTDRLNSGSALQDLSANNAVIDMRNRAGERGADVILFMSDRSGQFGGRVTGEAYDCSKKEKEASAQLQVPIVQKQISAVPPDVGALLSSPDAPYDFRKATWGMSKMEVSSAEIGELLTQDSYNVTYSSKIYGLGCVITYSFDNDRLIRGTITIIENHSDINKYLSDFNAIKSIMTTKYGKPATENAVWRNDLYKEVINKWGEAIQLGHLLLFAKWNFQSTLIHLQISGENGKIKLGMQYRKP
jgi:hypothetical protein